MSPPEVINDNMQKKWVLNFFTIRLLEWFFFKTMLFIHAGISQKMLTALSECQKMLIKENERKISS